LSDHVRRVLGSRWLRGLVTAVLLGVVLTQFDFSKAGRTLADADWGWFVAAVALMAVGIVAAGIRWWLLLRAAAFSTSRRKAVRLFSLSVLLNSVLPTAVGGDAVRIWIVGRHSRRYVTATTSVLLDKVTAFASLFLVAGVALLADYSAVPSEVAMVFAWTTAVFAAGILAVAVALVASGRMRHRLPDRVRAAAGEVAVALRGWAHAQRLLLSVFALGVTYQVIAVGALVLLAESLGFSLAFSLAAVSAAVVVVAMLLPISIGGFGVREGGFVLLLGKAGIGATDATLLSLLSVLVLILASAVTLVPLAVRPSELREPSSADV
jgi:glycosyltransferase 2 family protein